MDNWLIGSVIAYMDQLHTAEISILDRYMAYLYLRRHNTKRTISYEQNLQTSSSHRACAGWSWCSRCLHLINFKQRKFIIRLHWAHAQADVSWWFFSNEERFVFAWRAQFILMFTLNHPVFLKASVVPAISGMVYFWWFLQGMSFIPPKPKYADDKWDGQEKRSFRRIIGMGKAGKQGFCVMIFFLQYLMVL